MSIASSVHLAVRGGCAAGRASVGRVARRGFVVSNTGKIGHVINRGVSQRVKAVEPEGRTEGMVESEPTWMDNTEDAQEAIIIEPRMTFGLDVHRRVHAYAMRQLAYQVQWRAYCERTKRDWRDAVTVEDEAVLCSFQYELEQGLQRYEDAKAAGELGTWPPRTLHPTQGLPAIGAALKAGGGRARAAVTDVCRGRERLFQNKGPGLGEGRSS